MMTVYKYAINYDKFTISLPKGATVLHANEQNNRLFLWAIVNPDAVMVRRRFHLVTTGEQIDEEMRLRYVNTFTCRDGAVFHLFEILEG